MKQVTFYLQAGIKKERGKPDSTIIWERYKTHRARINDRGRAEYDEQRGIVDEDIRVQNKEEYKKFRAFVDANIESLSLEAGKVLNEPYEFNYEAPPAAKEVVKVVVSGLKEDFIPEEIDNG